MKFFIIFLVLCFCDQFLCRGIGSFENEGNNSLSSGNPFNEVRYQNIDSCGIMSKTAGLIQGGEFSSRIQFPWIAVISRKNNDGIFTHKGSGSLISTKHVLAKPQTVATIDDSTNLFIPVDIDKVKVSLGTVKFDNLTALGSVERDVSRIIIHPNAKKISRPMTVYKVAIIELDHEVTFTDYIRPICLWPFTVDLDAIVGKDAYGVGYGVDETGVDSLLRKHVHVTVLDETSCKDKYSVELQQAQGVQQFCVKSNKNEGSCYRDHQLYMKIDSVWYLRGIVSAGATTNYVTCEVSVPTLYEDIAQHIDWIRKEI